MTVINLDLETRGVLDLTRVGLWNYSRHHATDVYCLAVSFDDGPIEVLRFHGFEGQIKVTGPEGLWPELKKAAQKGATFVAHNAAFEFAIWQGVIVPKYKAPMLRLKQMECTMAAAHAMGLPPSLEACAPALGLPVAKDTTGRTLMLRLCKPTNAAALANGKAKFPVWLVDQKKATFMGKSRTREWLLSRQEEYCKQDVNVQRHVRERVRPLSADERKIWVLDQTINRRGAAFDRETVKAATRARDKLEERINEKLSEATTGAVQAHSALPALKGWLAKQGVEVESLAKDAIEELLLSDDLPEAARRALELRREAGRLTSVAKVDAIDRMADPKDYRVRYLVQYHAANTGRFGGRGVQPHNFTRDLPPSEDVEFIFECLRSGDIDAIDMIYDAPLDMISQAMRGLIVAGPQRLLVGGDWSNVEGRGLAWMAGEEWKLHAFRAYDEGTGPDVYCASYSSVFNTPVSEVVGEKRQIGKVMELALGYQGGVGAFQSMAGQFGLKIEDEMADRIKTAWRERHPATVRLWYQTQRAAMAAVRNPGRIYAAGSPGRQVKYRKAGSFLWCRLPSGRLLCYPYPEIRDGKYGDMLTYKRVPSPEDRRRGRIVEDEHNTATWARIGTYGGMLTENNTQAICRDILVEAMVNLEKAGYPVVLHIHDEVISEGPDLAEEDRAAVEKIMNSNPAWTPDFPLNAECWLSPRYIKH